MKLSKYTYSANLIINTTSSKLSKMINKILRGEVYYKTLSGKIVDFGNQVVIRSVYNIPRRSRKV